MALTLVEAAKKHSGDVVRSSVIEIFARSSDLLRTLPFDNIDGNALKYNRENTLPGIAFRGVNQAYSEATGVINPIVETLAIAGGDLDVDKFITRTMGEDQRASQEAMKIKALAHEISNAVVKGDSATTVYEFDGLQLRLAGNQLVSNGTTSGGDPLQLSVLDQTIDAVDEPTHLLMSKACRRFLTAASRLSTVGGFIATDVDEYGRQIYKYADLPILIADGNADANATLAFNEASAGGGTTGTSIYCLSLKEGMLTGIQNGDMEVTDLGELDTQPLMRTRVEWYCGLALWHPRAAARMYGIKSAAAVV